MAYRNTTPSDNPDSSDSMVERLSAPEYVIPPPSLSVWQYILGQSTEKQVDKMRKTFANTAAGLGRQPTQEEVTVLCDITYKEARTVALMMPLGIALGAAMAWRGRATYRFPLYQPKFVKFDPEVFPSARATYFSGPTARIAWHQMRFSLYTVLAAFSLAPLLASYGTSVAIATAARDPRLANFRNDMKPARLVEFAAEQMPTAMLLKQRERCVSAIRQLERDLEQLQSEKSKAESQDPGRAEMAMKRFNEQEHKTKERIEDLHKILAHLNQTVARRGGDSLGSDGDVTSRTNDYESLSASESAGDMSLPSAPRETPAPEANSGWGWGKQSSNSQQGWDKVDSDSLDYDDASPVASGAKSTPRSSSSSGTSAWDRLRQSNKAPQSRPVRPEDSGNDYVYDGPAREMESEKDRAQREFDRMLERERQSQEGQGSGRNSRW
ncbi:hypothetical protein C8035_v001750 [Colletotrichum spinosum]|uniref:Uncharacterized protein n=1 Tax=Colletotrichum spinosum TaxID=1347390 RepID=A0A4R8QF14_9PEZI|nr:hypothetical protein C8035_v001750 [Colletotrichum spinosum]